MRCKLTLKGKAVARLLQLGEYCSDDGILFPQWPGALDKSEKFGEKLSDRLWLRWLGFRVWLQKMLHGKNYKPPIKYKAVP